MYARQCQTQQPNGQCAGLWFKRSEFKKKIDFNGYHNYWWTKQFKFWARKEGETNSSDKHKVLENPNWQETKQLAYLHSTAEQLKQG